MKKNQYLFEKMSAAIYLRLNVCGHSRLIYIEKKYFYLNLVSLYKKLIKKTFYKGNQRLFEKISAAFAAKDSADDFSIGIPL